MSPDDLNRRELITGLLSVGGDLLTPKRSHGQYDAPIREPQQSERDVKTSIRHADVKLTINGKQHEVAAMDAHTTLLDCLRDWLQLTGTKKGCGLGHCGACTVLIDGRRVTACLTLAIMQQGRDILTIEGLASSSGLHPMQAAFVECDGYQCGYCTPGQIMSAVACVQEGHTKTDDEIREWMSGNICRCGAYPNIVAAVRQVVGRE